MYGYITAYLLQNFSQIYKYFTGFTRLQSTLVPWPKRDCYIIHKDARRHVDVKCILCPFSVFSEPRVSRGSSGIAGGIRCPSQAVSSPFLSQNVLWKCQVTECVESASSEMLLLTKWQKTILFHFWTILNIFFDVRWFDTGRWHVLGIGGTRAVYGKSMFIFLV